MLKFKSKYGCTRGTLSFPQSAIRIFYHGQSTKGIEVIPSTTVGISTLDNSFISKGDTLIPKTPTNLPMSMCFTSTPESSPSKTDDNAVIAYVHLLSSL